jgi:hypothetical protein
VLSLKLPSERKEDLVALEFESMTHPTSTWGSTWKNMSEGGQATVLAIFCNFNNRVPFGKNSRMGILQQQTNVRPRLTLQYFNLLYYFSTLYTMFNIHFRSRAPRRLDNLLRDRLDGVQEDVDAKEAIEEQDDKDRNKVAESTCLGGDLVSSKEYCDAMMDSCFMINLDKSN